jgi:RNA polymerase sigma-70 factor (ECF subfamily)
VRNSSRKIRKKGRAAATILAVMAERPTPPTPDAVGPGGRAGRGGTGTRPPVDWAAALATHDRWLRTAVLARLGERQAVDEVMQEVALAAVAQRAPLSDPSRVGAWLYRLAVRQVLLYRRRRGRQRRLEDRYAELRGVVAGNEIGSRHGDRHALAPVPTPEPDPLAWLVLDERRHLVRAALGRVARRDAEILLLKYTEDWTYHELAVHLGISESAVEARLHRARRRLREVLAAARVTEVEVSE